MSYRSVLAACCIIVSSVSVLAQIIEPRTFRSSNLCGSEADSHLCASFNQPDTAAKVLREVERPDLKAKSTSALVSFTATARCGGNPDGKELVYFLDLQIRDDDADPEPFGRGTVRVGVTTVQTGIQNQTFDTPVHITRLFDPRRIDTISVVGKPTWLRGANLFCQINGGELSIVIIPQDLKPKK